MVSSRVLRPGRPPAVLVLFFNEPGAGNLQPWRETRGRHISPAVTIRWFAPAEVEGRGLAGRFDRKNILWRSHPPPPIMDRQLTFRSVLARDFVKFLRPAYIAHH